MDALVRAMACACPPGSVLATDTTNTAYIRFGALKLQVRACPHHVLAEVHITYMNYT